MLNLDSSKFNIVSRRTRSSDLRLRLTSMIDMFTILLVFLLKSYSAEGQIVTISKDLRLPDSTAEKPPIATPIVIVTQDWLLLDDDQLITIKRLANSKTLEIRTLRTRLAQKRRLAEKLGALETSLRFKGDITIQGDKEIPFRILKKIMYTCGQVGYNNIHLAVNKVD